MQENTDDTVCRESLHIIQFFILVTDLFIAVARIANFHSPYDAKCSCKE